MASILVEEDTSTGELTPDSDGLHSRRGCHFFWRADSILIKMVFILREVDLSSRELTPE
jgi:hypothetical protein